VSQARIVAVEDNAADILLLRDALSQAGISFSLELHLNGEEAVRALASMTEVPDLILLDLNLPRLHGFEVLKAIREHPVLAHAKVAIFTTSQAARDKLQSEKLGANAYIMKPPGYEEFLARVGEAIKALLARPEPQLRAASGQGSDRMLAYGNRRPARRLHARRPSVHGYDRLRVRGYAGPKEG